MTGHCGSCAHCDTDEAWSESASTIKVAGAGVCTLYGGWFNGKPVPVWLTCPEYEPIALPQGDGDMGDAA